MKQKTGRKLLGVLLTLVMVIGLLPGMGLTAYATEQSVTFTAPGTQNGITVSADLYYSNAFFVNNKNKSVYISSSGDPITRIVLTDAKLYENHWGSSYLSASAGTVSFDGSTMTVTDINATSVNIIGTNKYYGTISSIVVYYENTHTHSFTYSASGATITATCGASGCDLADNKTTLTIVKPTLETYGEIGKSAEATLTGLSDFNTATGKTISETDIKYAGRDGTSYTESTTAPTNAGKYTAKIEVTGVKTSEGEGKTVTATVDYEIAKAEPKAGDFTFTAPSELTYNGNQKSATVVPKDGITGMGDVMVKYYSDAACTDEVQRPTNAGTYYVGITVTVGDNYSATTSVLHDASWEFTINKGNPIANAPSGLTASYGQKLSDVTLTNPTGNTPGSWSWADSSTSVGSVGEHTFKANFTPEDTANYNSKENVDVAVTVGKAANPATVNGTASVKKGGNELDLQGNVKLNGATGKVSYAISGEALGCTLSGSKLTSGNTEGSVTVNVTVAEDDNYNASASMPITVTITKKDTQTITAEDVTATYGDTGVKVAATTDGDGQISYAVKDGRGEYIGIMKDTGVLTLIKAGTGTVVVTASETSTYAQATKEVTVTINKAASTPAKVTANNRTYDGKKKNLLTVEGEASGGTMMYALGSETAPGAEYSEDIPAAADIGTYYVWYKVIGDENHLDTEAESIEVKIDKAKGDTDTDDIFYVNVEGEDGEWTKGSSDCLQMTFKRSVVDSETFGHFTGILVDGVAVDPSDYTAESGSVVINLKASYLEKLTVGEHILTAQFDDAEDTDASFTVKEEKKSEDMDEEEKSSDNTGKIDETEEPENTDKSADIDKTTDETARDADVKPADTSASDNSADAGKTADDKSDDPKTGDEANPQLMLLVMLLAVIDMALVAFIRSKKREN